MLILARTTHLILKNGMAVTFLRVRSVCLRIIAGLLIGFSCTPKEEGWQPLWNGQDFTGWIKFLGVPRADFEVPGQVRDTSGQYTQPLGRENDPLNVFSVVEHDGEPAIRISGQVFGTLHTEQEYGDYHLRLQYKWGEKKWPPREDLRRDSGLLYAGFGEPGVVSGNWMQSHECQIQEHDTGDYWAVGAVEIRIPSVPVRVDDDPLGSAWFQYDPNGERRPFGTFITDSSQIRKNRRCIRSADEEFPSGQWNTVDLIFFQGNSIHVVNGKVVLRLYGSKRADESDPGPLTSGKILLQSEGAEVYYRGLEIRSISAVPEQFR